MAASTFLFWLSLYFYVPFLPLRAQDLGASNTMLGAVVASYAIAQVGLRIPIGIGADAIGRRKPFAVAALVASALGALGLALSPNPWSLFAARAVTGIAGAGWVAITVLYASYFAAGDAAKAMSRIMAVNALALVLATFIGGVVADQFGTTSTFTLGVVVGAAGAVLMLLADEPPLADRRGYSARAFLEVARVPLLVSVSVIGITVQFVSFATSFGFVPVYAEQVGASDAEVGYVTTVMFATSVLGTLVTPWLVARTGYGMTLALGIVVTALGAVLVPATSDVIGLAATQVLNGLGRGSTNALLITLAVLAVAPAQRATAMGVYQAVYAIGMLSGPVVAGAVADTAGIDAVFYLSTVVGLLGAALLLMRPLPRA